LTTSLNAVSPLVRYGHNLTLLAHQGVFSPAAGGDAEVTRIFQMLLQRQRKTTSHCNPMILDLDGRTRWPVIGEVIRRMALGEAPDPLPTTQVIALDYEALLSSNPNEEAAFKAAAPAPPAPEEDDPALDEWEPAEALDSLCKKYFPKGLWPPLEEWVAPDVVMQRLQALFLAVRQAEGQILLFVDHFHRLMGGELDRYPISGFNLLKPTLARGELQLMGACTLSQYRRHIERDQAIARHLQEVCLPDTWEEIQRLRASRLSTEEA